MENKLLIIGIDSMDPHIVGALDLPNLKGLMTYRSLQTTIPPETPVAWSAASTGRNPGAYGIFDFMNRDPNTYLPQLNLAQQKRGVLKTEYVCAMRGVPFWRILSDNKIASTVIRWPVTFPPEKVRGRMLSGLGVVDVKGMLGGYSHYTNGKVESSEEGSEKVIPIEIVGDTVETYVSGPLVKKDGKLKDVRTPLKITLGDAGVTLLVDGREYSACVGGWSEMARVKFKVYLKGVHGLFQVYLESVEPVFRMYMSSIQVDPVKQFVDITHPREYGRELADSIGLFYTLGMPEDTKAVTEGVLSKPVFLEQIKRIEGERERMFQYEYKRFKEGLLAFVFDAGDRLKHIFWGGMGQDDGGKIPVEVEDYYVGKDRLVGEVLDGLDDDTKLMVFSDHGFSYFRRQVNVNSWLVDEGYMSVKGGGDLLFGNVDWGKTQAYSLGFTSLYLNVRGRERDGVVDQTECEDLVDELKKKLMGVTDAGTNVFTNVYKSSDIYTGDFAHMAPDIVLGFNEGYRMSWKSAAGGLDPQTISDNTGKWVGDHLVDRSHVPGVLFTNFEVSEKEPNIMDVAPTVLDIFKLQDSSMEGKSLYTR